MKIKTTSDMGCIKIFNDTMSIFFLNGYGDADNTINIKKKHDGSGEFLGHFTVKTKAYLSQYDCEDMPIHSFTKGRWFVYLIKELNFVIVKEDMSLTS